MGWSYDPEDQVTPLNRVRLRIGDTDADKPQLQDEEVQSFIDISDSETGAAVLCARALAARYARFVDKWVGDLKILASQRHRAYVDLQDQLVATGGRLGTPYAGGIRVAQKESIEEDDSLVYPNFRLGMHDNRHR